MIFIIQERMNPRMLGERLSVLPAFLCHIWLAFCDVSL
jgi:hypothetical protein